MPVKRLRSPTLDRISPNKIPAFTAADVVVRGESAAMPHSNWPEEKSKHREKTQESSQSGIHHADLEQIFNCNRQAVIMLRTCCPNQSFFHCLFVFILLVCFEYLCIERDFLWLLFLEKSTTVRQKRSRYRLAQSSTTQHSINQLTFIAQYICMFMYQFITLFI